MIQQRSADEQRGIFGKSTSLCLRRSFRFSTSNIPYSWQRKEYVLDFASISRYIFASMDFRISFSRNEWLSFSEWQSTHGTLGSALSRLFFLHSLSNCRELQAIVNALCNSQDILLFFLLPTTSSLWAVICSQAAELLVISFSPHCSPCLSELLSLSWFFICGYVSSLVRDSRLENETDAP